MKKILLISLTLVLLTSTLLAQRAMRSDFDRPRAAMGDFLEELNLSDAQKIKFAEARATLTRQENTILAEISNLKLDIAEAMKAENIKRVKELNQQLTNKELQLKNARTDMFAANMKELSKEQKEILKKNFPHMYMLGHGPGDGLHQMRSARGARRAPGMGQRMGDWEHCDEYDGSRKHKNRK